MVLLIGQTYLSGFCGLFQGCAEAEERVKTGNYKDKKYQGRWAIGKLYEV